MLKKIVGIALCLIAFNIPSFANSIVNSGVDSNSIQDYITLWSDSSATLYADPAFIHYGKSSNAQHKNCDICAASIILTPEGSDVAVVNLVIYDFNCKTKKIYRETKIDVKKNKTISRKDFSAPIVERVAPNNNIEKEMAKLKDIQQLQTFNNSIRQDS